MKKILLLATLLSITSIGHGQVLLINDTFNRTGGLNGTDPTSSNVPETWTADSSITTNGSSVFIDGTGGTDPLNAVTGYIGIPVPTPGNLTVGKTYTLQLDMGQSHGGGAWTTAGFGAETPANTASLADREFWAIDNGAGIAIYDNVGNQLYYSRDPGSITGDTHINSGTVDLTIKVGLGSDTLSATIDGTTVVSGYNVSLGPISDVFVGNYLNTTGSFSNLSVTEVPEPSTWAMLLGGVGALFVVQRLRRKLSV